MSKPFNVDLDVVWNTITGQWEVMLDHGEETESNKNKSDSKSAQQIVDTELEQETTVNTHSEIEKETTQHTYRVTATATN